MNTSLSVIISAINGETRIENLYESIKKLLDALYSIWDNIFIDDGSDYETWNVMGKLALKNPQHV